MAYSSLSCQWATNRALHPAPSGVRTHLVPMAGARRLPPHLAELSLRAQIRNAEPEPFLPPVADEATDTHAGASLNQSMRLFEALLPRKCVGTRRPTDMPTTSVFLCPSCACARSFSHVDRDELVLVLALCGGKRRVDASRDSNCVGDGAHATI